jgi:hypothetical protein
MTPFRFEHVFSFLGRAASVEAVFETYFDPDHQQLQDRALGIRERTLLELVDDGDVLRRVCRVVPERKLPAVIRPFLPGGALSYVETATWRRRDDAVDLDIRPGLLGGRATIGGVYKLTLVPDGVHRCYAGEVKIELPLVAARIERGLVAELATSMPRAAGVTQRWLDGSARMPAASAQ